VAKGCGSQTLPAIYALSASAYVNQHRQTVDAVVVTIKIPKIVGKQKRRVVRFYRYLAGRTCRKIMGFVLTDIAAQIK